MITINTEKGLIDVHSWNDILERPGFRSGLNPSEHELKSIIGRYIFGDKVPCGLSNCRTPHAKGFVVTTKDGLETNIGKDCGSKYFGIDFDEQAKQFERDLAAKEDREMLFGFTSRVSVLEERIKILRSGSRGADWVNRNCQTVLNPAKIPVLCSRKLSDLAKQKSARLTVPREATKAEFDQMSNAIGKNLKWPQYVDEVIAEIRGIEALYQEYNLRNLLIVEVEEKLRTFKLQNIDFLSTEKLRYWKKWVLSLDQIIERAEFAVNRGRLLFSVENLKPLLKLPGMEAAEYRTLFETFLATLKPEEK